MVLEIDTTARVIRVKGQVNLNELMTFLMKQFEFEWTEWRMEQWQHITLGGGQWAPVPDPWIQPNSPGLWPQSQPYIQPSWITPGSSPITLGDIIAGSGNTASGVTGSTTTNGYVDGHNVVDDLLKLR